MEGMSKPRKSGITAGLIVLLVKLGPKLVALLAKLAKGLKFGKVALFGTSAAAYAFVFSWKFAAVIMIQLLVHESGHIWAMRQRGMKTKGIYFIPFVGGAAVADDAFKTREDEYYVAIMGPIWGFGLALAFAAVAAATDSLFFGVAANWMAAVNFFNLLPVNPLDGGRMLKSIAFSIHSWLGFIVMGLSVVAIVFMSHFVGLGLVVLLLLVSTLELLLELHTRRRGRMLATQAKEIKASLDRIQKKHDEFCTTFDADLCPPRMGDSLAARREEVFKSLDDIIEKHQETPTMGPAGIVLAAACYVILAATIFAVMWATNHGPSAMEIFLY
jgi:Zn-dependent protease